MADCGGDFFLFETVPCAREARRSSFPRVLALSSVFSYFLSTAVIAEALQSVPTAQAVISFSCKSDITCCEGDSIESCVDAALTAKTYLPYVLYISRVEILISILAAVN
jgi:hypothetical protein